METIAAIVIIVFGVLEIILFFKVWGMTNNVKAIRNRYEMKDITFRDKAYIAAVNGNTKLAKKFLDQGCEITLEHIKKVPSSEIYQDVKKDYDELYELFDVEKPNEEN